MNFKRLKVPGRKPQCYKNIKQKKTSDRTLTRHLTQVADGFMQLLLSNVPSSADHQFQSEHTNMQPLATNTPATNTSKMWLYISKLRTVIILLQASG